MNLNRPLIKQQAKGLIRNNVFKLFAIQLIVMICISGIFLGGYSVFMGKMFSMGSFNQIVEDNTYDYFDDYDINDDFNNFGAGGENDFYNFGNYENDFPGSDFYSFGAGDQANNFGSFESNEDYFFEFISVMIFVYISFIIGYVALILLSPLEVSLSGLFVSFIRGNRFDFSGGLSNVFKNTFKQHYGKKLGLIVLRGICVYFLSWLFIIPGIVYWYSTYFANQIMCDNPDISPSQALDVSKKMIKGNRWELFVMNLSFIPWYLLCTIGFGLPYIYVWPYVSATNALYYENFRIRALQEGRVTEDDFLSDAQRYAKYAQMYANSFNPQNMPNGNPNTQNPYYGNPNPYNNPYGNANAQYAPGGSPNMQNQPYGNVNQQYNPYAAPYQQPPYNSQGNMYNSAPQPNYAPPYANAAPVQPETQAQPPEVENVPQETAQDTVIEEPVIKEPMPDSQSEQEKPAESENIEL